MAFPTKPNSTERWPLGRYGHPLETYFDGGIPSWLSLGSSGADAGSSSGSPTSDPGGIKLTTAASLNATATLTGPEFNLGDVRACRLWVDFTGGQTTERGILFGFVGAADGAWVQQITTSVARLYGRKTSVDNNESTDYVLNGSGLLFCLNLAVTPWDGGIYLNEFDECFGYREDREHGDPLGTNVGTGPVRPIIQVTARTAAAASFDIHHILFERFWQ
jgi:hypothetical protein